MAATREVIVTTKLKDELTFRHMSGREGLSALFDYRVELLSENDGIKLEEILGTPLMLTMALPAGAERYFHGHVAQFVYAGTEGSFARYHARVRPWLWFLSTTTDCRVFQDMSVAEIIEQIFVKYPVASYSFNLNESHVVRDYCVQYNESDLNFVQRLCEDEGIFFYFEHKDGEHKMILADNKEAYLQRKGYEEVPFYPPEDKSRRERDHLYEWRSALDVRSGRFSQTSFDFERPRADLATRRSAPLPHSQSEGEVYCYPANYTDLDQGNQLALIRLEEVQAAHKRMRGAGTAAGLGCGQTFSLTNHPRKDQNDKYLVLAVEHEIWADAYRSASSGGEEEPYLCTIEVQPAAVSFRPPLVTPKPVMSGPESATVTGPPNEEIWTDPYGRVKVQFPWDRLGNNDENSSCWIRVSQLWAGSGFGGIHIPRIGQEVLVEFLQGDIDRPIITGRVYDGSNMPPYDLPANATQSGIKSDSSKGGGGSNELQFEDKKGDERVFLHAQKDLSTVVENDESHTVGHDRTTTIKHDDTLTVKHDRTTTIEHDDTLTVKNDRTTHVQEGADTLTVHKGDRSVTVSTGAATLTVAAKNREVSVPKATYKVDAKTVEISGADEIKLVVGANSIKIDKSGVTIFGTLVKIN